MAQGLFRIGFTKQEILAILNQAKADLARGTYITKWNAGDTGAEKESTMDTAAVIVECQDALQYLFPNEYGRVITRTVPDYSGCG